MRDSAQDLVANAVSDRASPRRTCDVSQKMVYDDAKLLLLSGNFCADSNKQASMRNGGMRAPLAESLHLVHVDAAMMCLSKGVGMLQEAVGASGCIQGPRSTPWGYPHPPIVRQHLDPMYLVNC